jgi:hypothetical protein
VVTGRSANLEGLDQQCKTGRPSGATTRVDPTPLENLAEGTTMRQGREYHHAKLVQEWLARPDCRIKLHFIPSYCPHLNPIERLWGLMHRNVTHNKTYETCAQFADAALGFLR